MSEWSLKFTWTGLPSEPVTPGPGGASDDRKWSHQG
jgi:hypothetical protein